MPTISGFKPYGASTTTKKSDSVFLLYEEYEVLRLCDYEKYNQLDASGLMGVSRPTLTRIYTSAKEKMALALVEGRRIIIEGGKVSLDSEWFHCGACGCYFNRIDDSLTEKECALCGSLNVGSFTNEGESALLGIVAVHCGRGKCQERGGKRRRRYCENED